MVLSVLSSIAYLLVMILLITIGAALLLGIGTVLTFLFAVSVWEPVQCGCSPEATSLRMSTITLKGPQRKRSGSRPLPSPTS